MDYTVEQGLVDYYDFIYQRARSLCNYDTVITDDISTKVIIQVMKYGDRFKGSKEDFGRFLSVVIRNESINVFRKRSTKVSCNSIDSDDFLFVDRGSDTLNEDDYCEVIRRFLLKRIKAKRVDLFFSVCSGMTYRDASTEYGFTIEMVKGIVHRCRKLVRAEFDLYD